MANYYEADQVDPLLKSAAATMRAMNEVLKEASAENKALTEEIARMKKAAVEEAAHKVVLEKVAAPVASEAKVNALVSVLVNHAIIREGDREKFATACRENPDNILDIATHALKLSESPVPQGSGCFGEKTATSHGKLTVEEENRASLEREARIWEKIREIGQQ